jgi:hypothetical protein
VLTTTAEHPFYVKGKGFVPAGELTVADTLQSASGDPITILDIDNTPLNLTAYNYAVADYHTYFVGESGVWVHNMCDVVKNGFPSVKKVANSNLPHARDRAVERGVFPDAKSAAEGLKDLSNKIKKEGFPEGTLQDTAHADRMLVPVGNNGLAVYQIGKNGTAKLKTTLIAN